MILRLALPVDDEVCALPIRAKEHSTVVDLLLGQAGAHIHRLEEGIRDSIREADEFDFPIRLLPVGEDGEDEAEGGGLRVRRRVGEGDEAHGRGAVLAGHHGGECRCPGARTERVGQG